MSGAYDVWRTGGDTPLGALDMQPEYDEGDQMEREHEEHMQAFQSWLNHADEVQLNAAERLLDAERERRRRTYAEKLRALGDADVKVPRAPRKDKGKPRTPKNGELPGEVLP